MRKGVEYHSMKIQRKTESLISNFWIECEELGIRGFIDAIQLVDDNLCLIIDYKQKIPYNNRIPEHYKAQLIAESLALERTLNKKIEKVVIKLPGGKSLTESITPDEVNKVLKAMSEIRKIIISEVIPEPTPARGKCTDCEYKIICAPL